MFESSLIDLEARKQPKRRRWISLPFAAFLHLLGLMAFAFASYWSVGAVQEPQTNVAFVDVALPPPPPAIQRGGGVKPPKPPETKPDVKPPAPEKPIQPDFEHMPDKPRDTPVRETTPDPDPSYQGTDPTAPARPGIRDGSDDSHSETGTKDGVPDPVPAESLPQHLTAEMSRPVPLRPILPKYTEVARRSGTQGTVIVEAIIDEQGNATNVRVLHGLPMGLDRAAMEAIQQTRFKPAMMSGRPVKVYYTLTVTFTIQR